MEENKEVQQYPETGCLMPIALGCNYTTYYLKPDRKTTSQEDNLTGRRPHRICAEEIHLHIKLF